MDLGELCPTRAVDDCSMKGQKNGSSENFGWRAYAKVILGFWGGPHRLAGNGRAGSARVALVEIADS